MNPMLDFRMSILKTLAGREDCLREFDMAYQCRRFFKCLHVALHVQRVHIILGRNTIFCALTEAI